MIKRARRAQKEMNEEKCSLQELLCNGFCNELGDVDVNACMMVKQLGTGAIFTIYTKITNYNYYFLVFSIYYSHLVQQIDRQCVLKGLERKTNK